MCHKATDGRNGVTIMIDNAPKFMPTMLGWVNIIRIVSIDQISPDLIPGTDRYRWVIKTTIGGKHTAQLSLAELRDYLGPLPIPQMLEEAE
jgi:hypothetical protein